MHPSLIVLAFLSGVFAWTLAEYLLHRFLGHVKKPLLVRTRFHKEHSKHHLLRHYFAGPRDKLLTVLVLGPKLFLISGLVIGMAGATSFTAGFLGMYFVYELVHYRMHVKAPPHAYASRMRAHHFAHHFEDESLNHGVTTAFWDRVFGTYHRPTTISYPAKFKLAWFNEGKEFRDRWGHVYRPAGKKKSNDKFKELRRRRQLNTNRFI